MPSPKRQIRAFLLSAVLVFALIVAGVGFVNNNWRQSGEQMAIMNRNKLREDQPPDSFDGLVLYCNLTSFDVSLLSFKMHLGSRPYGSFRDSQDDLGRSPSLPMQLTVDSQLIMFPSNQIMASQDLEMTVKSGTPNSYPFDSYTAEFYVTGTAPSLRNKRYPISFSLKNSMEEWWVEFRLTDASGGDFNMILVEIILTRGANQKFFSIFICLLMWIMSLALLALAIAICRKHSNAVATTMLFALPAVRDIQPGRPPIGCTADGLNLN
ncbi:hypothetical protein EDD86DRAFT_247548 [Gorgonomyces haynaldii]|nr:hypothetical protein EDD86DRAFT_247548 [Gorgonomyces haynaldii]